MRTLSFGSTGPLVQLLQTALTRYGFPLAPDGSFGSLTRDALLRFQRENALVPDGVAGAMTHRALLPWYTGFVMHRLQRGDTFYLLARRYKTSVPAIELANPTLAAASLPVGELVTVPLGFDVVATDIACSSPYIGYCVRGLAARYPFLRLSRLGKSVLGRPLWCMTLGRGENRVLYNASHHANEWIATTLLLRFTEELCKAFASGGSLASQSAAEIFDYATLSVVPAVNPDGIDLVTGELSGGDFYEAAKRIAASYPQYPFPSGWKANLRGTDLNLQYPADWEQARENKYAQGIVSPAPADFVGVSPLSAPESRALYEYTLRFLPALTLSYHTQGEVIYWKYLDYEPVNSRTIAEAFSAVSGYAVEDTPFLSGFAGYKDWFIEAFDRPGYTIEAGRGINPLPLSQFDDIYHKNLGILTLGTIVT